MFGAFTASASNILKTPWNRWSQVCATSPYVHGFQEPSLIPNETPLVWHPVCTNSHKMTVHANVDHLVGSQTRIDQVVFSKVVQAGINWWFSGSEPSMSTLFMESMMSNAREKKNRCLVPVESIETELEPKQVPGQVRNSTHCIHAVN